MRDRRDDGFTLVELMMALTILSIGIGSVVHVFHASFAVASEGNNRSRAVALATKEAEAMRAVPYDRLGFSPVQAGFTPAFEGAVTVVVGDPVVQPFGPDQVLGGMTFQFARQVVWADAASTAGYAQAYKRVVVVVTWSDQAMAHAVRQEAFVYPGGQGVYTGPQGGVTTTTTVVASPVPPSPPLALAATVPTGASGASTVDLAWTPNPISTPPVSTWVVQFSTDSFATAHLLTDTQPASVTSYSATGLSASTAYQFRVAAKAANGLQSSWSVMALATTTSTLATVCQLGTATLTPSAVNRLNGASTLLSADAVASVNATGVCSGLQLRYSARSGSTNTAYLIAGTTGVWVGTVNGITTAWDTGTHQVQVVDGGGNVLGALTLTVCVHNAKTCP
ncbi:MAG: Fibronectin type domain [Acidimicrobiaceae bacterium]|nr:Fibronectin type domain [Acidimicrobiaceae bacterium]